MPGIFILLLIAVVIAIGIGSAKTREALNRSWGSVAERFGLHMTPAEWSRSPKLVGDIDGYPLVIDIEKRRAGKHKSVWTRFRLGMPSLNLGLELKEEGFLSQISKVFGGQDIEVGDAAFDDRLLIKGDDARAIRAFLTPARRAEIENFFITHSGTVINDQGISWAKRGRMAETPELLAVIDEMLSVGRALVPQDERLSSAALATGLSATAAFAPMHARFATEALPDRAVWSEARLAGGAPVEFESEGAAPIESDSEGPGRFEVDPDSTARVEAGSKQAAPGEASFHAPSPGAPAGDEPQPMPAVDSVGVAEFCDAVFAPGALSYAAAQTFRQNYQGQSVDWTGRLRSAETYGFDFVFGSGGGIKARIELQSADEVSPGAGAVLAIVQLPANTEGLDARLGERISFTGSLTKVDGLSRQVFVSRGRLGP